MSRSAPPSLAITLKNLVQHSWSVDREEIIYLVLLDLAEEETDHFLLPQEVLWRQLVRGGLLCCSRVENKVYNITGGGYQETIRLLLKLEEILQNACR